MLGFWCNLLIKLEMKSMHPDRRRHTHTHTNTHTHNFVDRHMYIFIEITDDMDSSL